LAEESKTFGFLAFQKPKGLLEQQPKGFMDNPFYGLGKVQGIKKGG